MKTVFSNKFLNQIGAVRFEAIRKKVETAILDVEKAGSLSEIKSR